MYYVQVKKVIGPLGEYLWGMVLAVCGNWMRGL
jgi:hypothetical protein